MWLFKGLDVTSNSEIQHPSILWRQGQGGLNLKETEYGGWGSDGNDGAMAGPSPPEAKDTEARGTGRGGRLGRQVMEEDENKRERRGNVGV